MKINWKVRLKNPWFWAIILITIGLTVLSSLNMKAEDITTWAILGDVIVSVIKNPYMIFTLIVEVIGCAIDPTTKGLSDSQRALGYTKPNK